AWTAVASAASARKPTAPASATTFASASMPSRMRCCRRRASATRWRTPWSTPRCGLASTAPRPCCRPRSRPSTTCTTGSIRWRICASSTSSCKRLSRKACTEWTCRTRKPSGPAALESLTCRAFPFPAFSSSPCRQPLVERSVRRRRHAVPLRQLQQVAGDGVELQAPPGAGVLQHGGDVVGGAGGDRAGLVEGAVGEAIAGGGQHRVRFLAQPLHGGAGCRLLQQLAVAAIVQHSRRIDQGVDAQLVGQVPADGLDGFTGKTALAQQLGPILLLALQPADAGDAAAEIGRAHV